MKLSLNWFRRTVTSVSAIAALLLIVHVPADAAPVAVSSDTLDEIGLVVKFEKAVIDPATKAVKTAAYATVEAKDKELAARLGIPTTEQKLKSIEGQIGKGDEDDGTLRALIVHAANDGVISFVVENGTHYAVPTKEGAEKLATMYGLAFGDVSSKVTLTNVSGSAAQAQLRKGDDVAAINLKPPVNALHAYALFFNAIRDSGAAVIQVGETGYRVPQSPSLAGVSRGVAGTGPQIQFPQFLDRGDQPIPESGNKSSSNEVITARVETYYFRDAHRLAQILNRGVQSYQAAAVSQLERAAQNAGENFELAKSRRRAAEFQAEQKAKELRQKKKELGELTSGIRSSLQDDAAKRAEIEQHRKELTQRQDQLRDLKNKTLRIRLDHEKTLTDLQNKKSAADKALTQAAATQGTATTNEATAAMAYKPYADRQKKANDAIAALETQLATQQSELNYWMQQQSTATATTNPSLTTVKNEILQRNTAIQTINAQILSEREKISAAIRDGVEKYQAWATAKQELDAAKAAATSAQGQVSTLEQQIEDETRIIAGLKQQETAYQSEIESIDTQIMNLEPQAGDASDRTTLDTLDQLVDDVKALETEVANATLQARQANEVEEQAAKSQFRAEVAAAKADPDTYAAGDLNSVDPVTQVSISVIGEGVLHLRGPRLGVVKIREMIHQLDHPVGQVKIGIMTVQLNGEQGHRMENTLRRMEGHLSRGRFLTYVSQELFKRSVAEVSELVAARSINSPIPSGGEEGATAPKLSPKTQQFSRALSITALDSKEAGAQGEFSLYGIPDDALKKCDPSPIDECNEAEARQRRWVAYAQDFFGNDFIAGIQDVHRDSPVLDPANKLLSLSSADSLTITEALFVTALAKADIRKKILDRFRFYLQCDLPMKDYHWIQVNNIKKGWDPRWWGEDCTKKEHIINHAQENYTFSATSTFLDREYWDSDLGGFDQIEDVKDRLNPFQREVIRLIQGLSMEFWLHGRRLDLIEKRELISQAAGPNSSGLTNAEMFVLNSEIDRLTEMHLNAQETVRGRKAALDKLIKQVVIAMEDDVYAQFYNPALERIRRASQEWDVELGSVERTTILTNNRAFGKVAPQATYQFDLPKRDIALAEAMKAAYALHQDLGPLVGDPNFNTLAKMFSQQSISGSTVDGTIKNVLPGLDSTTDQQNLLYADSTQPQKFGTELEKLIPDPAIYKFETGTGFQVRPVVQPDGQSVVFDFDYMYTTDLLEPTSPDERGLGRVKRHFVDTEVQLGNLEWREISRYEVALKAARNSRGVPLLEDIPVVGLAFRPLPQAKKSIQKNVIVGQAAIYPTVEDLLGLKSPSAAGLDVHQMPFALDKMQEAQRKHSEKLDALLNLKVEGAIPGFGTTSTTQPSGTEAETAPQLVLPTPIQRLSFEAPAADNSAPATELSQPGKPGGSAPASVRSPRPSSR